MRKLFLYLIFLSYCSFSYSQNVVVQTTNNSNKSSNEDCNFRINGICSKEDIGGVDIRFVGDGYRGHWELENFNSCTVTTLLLVESAQGTCGDQQVITVVLKPRAKRSLEGPMCYNSRGSDWTYNVLIGSITRKVK